MEEEKVSEEVDDNEIKEEEEDDDEKKEFSFGENKNNLSRFDSFDVETGKVPNGYTTHSSHQNIDWTTLMKLAFQSIGVVYGDIGTSPLYVLPGIFPDGIKDNDDLLGVLSLIIYTLTLITLIKYVFIVLSANDNGDGGTFALYSLICRYARVGLLPNHQAEDQKVSNYRLEAPNRRFSRASAVKSMLEKSHFAKYMLLFITMLGTSMVIGDGVLTPCISGLTFHIRKHQFIRPCAIVISTILVYFVYQSSGALVFVSAVLSAVGGIREAAKGLTDNTVMWISVAILILLFQVQRFGTDKVGYSFAPILTIWFFFISCIGIYNFVKYDPSVIKALNPMYIVHYFMRNKKDAWISLGGIVLCLTGSEALFADLGHFNVRSIQISTCAIVFPSIILAYAGQASYLRKHNFDVANAFYKSVPVSLYWPMFVVAVLAAIIASQSLISASFSIVQQSLALGCFPKVKVVHTSSQYKGQVYIPEINFLLMFACIGVTLGFKNTLTIGNAYGIAVVFVMSLTSALLVLVMVMIWKTNCFFIITYILTIMLLELLYLSSVLYKFADGGYLPLIFAAFMMSVMYTWNYVYRKKYMYDLENKVSIQKLKEIASDREIRRLPGLAVFYSELVHGISPIFTHYIANVPALHSILLFVSIKFLPISKVPPEERFLFRRVQPHELGIFRCVVRYGYTEEQREGQSFEEMLVRKLKEFITEEVIIFGPAQVKNHEIVLQLNVSDSHVDVEVPRIDEEEEVARELQLVENECRDSGVTYLLGQNEVVASKGSNFVKRIMINYAYNLLRRCLRQQEEVYAIPRKRLLKVGMTYEL